MQARGRLLNMYPLGLGAPRNCKPPCTVTSCPLQMAPLGDRLLVKPREAESVTAGGILLSTRSEPHCALLSGSWPCFEWEAEQASAGSVLFQQGM